MRSFDGTNFEITRVYSGVDKVPKSKIRRAIFYMGDYVEHKRYGIYYHAAMFMKCEDDDEDRRRAVVLCTIRYVEDGATVLVPAASLRAPREDPIQKGENVEIVRYEDNLWGTVTKVDETGLLEVTPSGSDTVEKFVNPRQVEDVYPEGTNVMVRLIPREYLDEKMIEKTQERSSIRVPGRINGISTNEKGDPVYDFMPKPADVYYRGDLIMVKGRPAVMLALKLHYDEPERKVRIQYDDVRSVLDVRAREF